MDKVKYYEDIIKNNDAYNQNQNWNQKSHDFSFGKDS